MRAVVRTTRADLDPRHTTAQARARMQRASILLSLVMAACGTRAPCGTAELEPLRRAPAFAVGFTDYSSSAIGMLDGEGNPITEAWIDSGSRATGIATALSGDVVLPEPLLPGTLAVIDRFN